MKALLQTLVGYVAVGMIGLPIVLETQPIAFFQNTLDGLIWYAITLVFLCLFGWFTDEDAA